MTKDDKDLLDTIFLQPWFFLGTQPSRSEGLCRPSIATE